MTYILSNMGFISLQDQVESKNFIQERSLVNDM